MNKVHNILFLLLGITSCNTNEVKDEIVNMPVSEAKIAEIEGVIFDTIDFSRTQNGLNYILNISDNNGMKPDTNSHVIIEYKLFSSKGELLIKRDTSDSVFQLYLNKCAEPLAEAICLLELDSSVEILIDGKSALPLYSKSNSKQNYLAKITLIDFHQH